tara:strand:+ start:6424 stop:6585 length:162 start_codon:yes stop_codon:yes gene_type:complete
LLKLLCGLLLFTIENKTTIHLADFYDAHHFFSEYQFALDGDSLANAMIQLSYK